MPGSGRYIGTSLWTPSNANISLSGVLLLFSFLLHLDVRVIPYRSQTLVKTCAFTWIVPSHSPSIAERLPPKQSVCCLCKGGRSLNYLSNRFLPFTTRWFGPILSTLSKPARYHRPTPSMRPDSRGHRFIVLRGPSWRLRRKSSFSRRAIKFWNRLSFSIVTTPFFNSFKRQLDSEWEGLFSEFPWFSILLPPITLFPFTLSPFMLFPPRIHCHT